MELSSIETIFRAYDIRGIFGKTLLPDIVSKIGTIFANIIKEWGGKKVGVSGDGRISTPALLHAATAGIVAGGIDVVMYEQLPISVFYFTIWKDNDLDGGAYITASHNPPEWNGIRFRKNDGTGFVEENKEIKKRFFKNMIKWVSWNEIGVIIKRGAEDAISDYIEFVSKVPVQPVSKLKVVIDTMNGIGGLLIPRLFRKKHDVITLNAQVDGSFPCGSPDPVHADLSNLCNVVINAKADVGVAFDGDADRAVIVDDKGRIVPAEVIGILLARNLLKPGDIVVHTPECSSILRDKLEEMGIKTVETRVGDVFVARAAKENNAKLGVEGSYHFFLPIYGFYYDDAILASYVTASILTEENKSLSKLFDEIGYYHVIRENIPVDDVIKWKVMEKLKDKVLREYSNVSTIDGVKIYLEGASILIRPSNTEPVIRMLTEAKSKEVVRDLHKRFKKMLKNTIGEVAHS